MPSFWESIFGTIAAPADMAFSRLLDAIAQTRNRMREANQAEQAYMAARRNAEGALHGMRPGTQRADIRMQWDADHKRIAPLFKRLSGLAADLDTIQRAVAQAKAGNRTYTLTPDGDIIIEGLQMVELNSDDIRAVEHGGVGLAIMITTALVLVFAISAVCVTIYRIAMDGVQAWVDKDLKVQEMRVEQGLEPQTSNAPLVNIEGGAEWAAVLTAPVLAGLAGLWFIFGRGR